MVPRTTSNGLIGILNLEMGNLRSVSNAVFSLGQDFRLVENPSDLESVSHLIVPGVGAFATAARRLDARGFRDPVREFAEGGMPVLGLCLGMQLLADAGDEGGSHPGLGLIAGRVARLDAQRVAAIPHVGWNSVAFTRSHPVLCGVRSGVDFYFVHSYRLVPETETDVLATTDCGEVFPSIAGHKNVVGVQFHPEKSQANGLRLIDNFCGWDGRC